MPVRQNLRVRGCSNSEPEGVVLHLFCSTSTGLGLVLGNRTVGKVQGSAQAKTLHSLATPMRECPQQMEDKQESSSLCCFSVGLHPAWSFEGFIQCLENQKQSSSAETALGPGCRLGRHLGTCAHSLEITRTCWEQGKIFQGAEVCGSQQNSTAEVTL